MERALFFTSTVGVVFLAVFGLAGFRAEAASAVAYATTTVIPAIGIQKTADLAFGSGAPGDTSKQLLPSETGAASFTVTGQANSAYQVQLPTSVNMTGPGGATIAVTGFSSNPQAGANGLLGSSGSQTLKVGATRAALPSTQASGQYTGSFSVSVIY